MRPLKGLCSLVLLVTLSLAVLYFLLMPDISRMKKENPGKTSFMEYRERESRGKGKPYRITQVWVPLSKVSPYVVKAVLIAEDDKFWKHEGFDYEAIQKAMERDIKAKKFKLGGSTISQQLAKNLYLSPSKNPVRKIAEAIITWRMERALSKKRILELYLNVIEWGDGIFGIEAASRHYYGKSSSQLSPEEAARLAAVLPNPRKYNPTGNQRYVLNRSSLISAIMVKRGIVVPEYHEVWESDEPLPEPGTVPPVPPIEKLNPAE
ncbi:MAG TPA: monofunctional biosynthetic peptidoglycan transglycosylase [Thermodesulfovibrionales bacterium]|jgi:monofunctional biosynthetic peptidoglycan transglycosylase|nr:monofunctional biosynthetic peptidoglycan transglycosylase [Thermodesulfovibrionales bacterium]